MTIDVPEVKQLVFAVTALSDQITALRSTVRPEKAWYTKKEAAALKGVNPKTLDANPYLWPNFGRGEIVGRTIHFRAEDVFEWLSKPDDHIELEFRAFRSRVNFRIDQTKLLDKGRSTDLRKKA